MIRWFAGEEAEASSESKAGDDSTVNPQHNQPTPQREETPVEVNGHILHSGASSGAEQIQTVSVIILTRNSQKHIGSCIESILKQNYANMEVLVIDAGSTDQTTTIVSQHLSGSLKPFEMIDAPRTTIGRARQIGVERAKGDILAYVDSDVELPHEDWITNMLSPFSDQRVGGTQTLAKNRNSDPWPLKRIHSSFEYKGTVIDIGHYERVGASHILLRKSAVVEVGGFSDVNFGEDTDLTLRMMKAGYKFIYLRDQRCYHHHVDGWLDYGRKLLRNKKYSISESFTSNRRFALDSNAFT